MALNAGDAAPALKGVHISVRPCSAIPSLGETLPPRLCPRSPLFIILHGRRQLRQLQDDASQLRSVHPLIRMKLCQQGPRELATVFRRPGRHVGPQSLNQECSADLRVRTSCCRTRCGSTRRCRAACCRTACSGRGRCPRRCWGVPVPPIQMQIFARAGLPASASSGGVLA